MTERVARLTPELVRLSLREVPDPGPAPHFTPMEEAELEAIADRLLAGHAGPVWAFAYGSLIWKPEFEVAGSAQAELRGWHRSFCIGLTRWRGSEDRPGLMLALERGGTCKGVIQRLPDKTLRADLIRLIRRELPFREVADMVRWSSVRTGHGHKKALVFWAGPRGPRIEPRLPLPVVASRLAHACGHGGSGAEYLYNTVTHLEELGIRDRNLWKLQSLVAEEILRSHHP